ncbi:hypothetical protein ATY41_11185 [Leifsonia xyli subsp. xyli]|uniref:Uncharacterized protein n=3 Tax=Leifsonia xyli TaxID=1575 RepID=Q6ACS7_LEIXX|nr:hypothetical protein Lxx21200 [Leifsonia xyli subsp. xyli str. CTCB07]ODA90154.1 hypothetical protein ATY41_11185 [Leifsonia xyli subsp. xyli]
MIAVLAAGAVVSALAGCSGSPEAPAMTTPVAAPVTVVVGELEGRVVELPRSTVLNIATGDGPASGWSATLTPPGVVRFQDGAVRSTFSTNPGIVPLRLGTAEVVLLHGGDQPIRFSVRVTSGVASNSPGSAGSPPAVS